MLSVCGISAAAGPKQNIFPISLSPLTDMDDGIVTGTSIRRPDTKYFPAASPDSDALHVTTEPIFSTSSTMMV